MKRVVVSRRQVLRGAGGFSLTLPFLPSLVPVPAYAANAVIAREPRFVALATEHGGVAEANMYPSSSTLTQSMELYPEHRIRWGKLQPTAQDGKTNLSAVMQAPAGKLTSALAAKMNIIQGLDIPWFIAHHTGGHLGNYGGCRCNTQQGVEAAEKPLPTIDQLLAYSNNFYRSTLGISQRAILTGWLSLSHMFSDPFKRSGEIGQVGPERDLHALFMQIFDPEPSRVAVVDRVLESYKRLKESNRRLSASDRHRLDDHMQRLAELQTKLAAADGRSGRCTDVKAPGAAVGRAYYSTLNDLVAAAFSCGKSRIAVMSIDLTAFSSYQGNFHEDIASWADTTGQPLVAEAHRNVFSDVFVDLLAKLDVEEQPGQTILDNTFVKWSQEFGAVHHETCSIPVLTAGSGAGAFETGRYIDYRNLSPKGRLATYGSLANYAGLTQNQLFATILQAFGMPPSDWQKIPHNGRTGYGLDIVDPEYRRAYGPQVMANASTPLPLLTRT